MGSREYSYRTTAWTSFNEFGLSKAETRKINHGPKIQQKQTMKKDTDFNPTKSLRCRLMRRLVLRRMGGFL